MATTRQTIARLDWIQLRGPSMPPAGAQGAVIDFIQDGPAAETEIVQTDLDGLDRIVYATPPSCAGSTDRSHLRTRAGGRR